ncbi:MAG: hypothetical protein K2Q14_05850 [Gammaproteobacteria bacterium]|nr:hypothetical protein [Gammaproteobacteria bacterium]
MSDNLDKFKHNIKTPLSTISVAVDAVKPFINALILEKENPDFNIENIIKTTQLETILRLLNNIEAAITQINILIYTLQESPQTN